jgi:hypothetical protein
MNSSRRNNKPNRNLSRSSSPERRIEECETDDDGYVIDAILGTQIPPDRLVRDVAGNRAYCFDIHTLYKLYKEKGTFINPFTTRQFSNNIIEKIKKYTQSKLVRIAYDDKHFIYDGETRLYELIADLYYEIGISYDIDRNLLINGTPVYDLDPDSYIEEYKLGNNEFGIVFGTVVNLEKLQNFGEFLRANENNGKIARLADLIENLTRIISVNIFNELGGISYLSLDTQSIVGALIQHLSNKLGFNLISPFMDTQLVRGNRKESIFNLSPTVRILSYMNYEEFSIVRTFTKNYVTVNQELINWLPQGWPTLRRSLIEVNKTSSMYKELYGKPNTKINIITPAGKSLDIFIPNNIHIMELLRITINYGNYVQGHNIYLGDNSLYNNIFNNEFDNNVPLDKARLDEQASRTLNIKNEIADYNGLLKVKKAICSYWGDDILNQIAINIQAISIYAYESDISYDDALREYVNLTEIMRNNKEGAVTAVNLYNKLINKATIEIEQLKNELRLDPRDSIINLINELPKNLDRQQYLLLDDILSRVTHVNR